MLKVTQMSATEDKAGDSVKATLEMDWMDHAYEGVIKASSVLRIGLAIGAGGSAPVHQLQQKEDNVGVSVMATLQQEWVDHACEGIVDSNMLPQMGWPWVLASGHAGVSAVSAAVWGVYKCWQQCSSPPAADDDAQANQEKRQV
jgi:hypothetical protein